jgi:hypothetical protein
MAAAFYRFLVEEQSAFLSFTHAENGALSCFVIGLAIVSAPGRRVEPCRGYSLSLNLV